MRMEKIFDAVRQRLAAGRPDEAERLVRDAAPRGRTPRLQLARLANEYRHWWLAEKLVRELIAEDSRDSEAWSALGFAAFSQGRHREARAALDQALSLNPRYDAARRNLAAVLCEQERSEEALLHIDELLRQKASSPALIRTRARALIQLNRFEEAEQNLLHAVASQPGDTAAHELLVRLRQLRGDDDPARELREAARSRTADPRVRMTYADCLRRLNDVAGAERELRALLGTLGNLPPLLGSLAAVLQD